MKAKAQSMALLTSTKNGVWRCRQMKTVNKQLAA